MATQALMGQIKRLAGDLHVKSVQGRADTLRRMALRWNSERHKRGINVSRSLAL